VTAPPPPSVYSIAIFVSDIGRAVQFYRDALALPLAKQGSFGAEFFGDGTRIGVHPAVHPDARALVGRHTGITLHVPGLLHYCGVLHDRGVRFVAEPTQQSWGIMAMVADPDGNVLALWEDQPAETAGTAGTAEHDHEHGHIDQADGAS
jgi:lactoylglutathione lyase